MIAVAPSHDRCPTPGQRWRVRIALFACVLALYLAFPTRDFYWDGVGFALVVQHPGSFGMIEANHPIYLGFASLVNSLVRLAAPGITAMRLLQALNSVLGAACAVMMYEIAREIFADEFQALLIAGVFSLSATWWKFATDCNAYIPAILVLVIAARFVMPGHRPMPVVVALLHTCAMLFHELAVLFFLPAAVGIYRQRDHEGREGLRDVAIYLAGAFALTSAAYFACFYVATGQTGVNQYLRWVTGHTPDSRFSFELARNLGYTIRGTLRLAAGGAVVLFRSAPLAVAAVLVTLGAGAVLIWRADPATGKTPAWRRAVPFLLAWVAAYSAFLFFWMPQNTFYRLFYLPPLALLCGVDLDRWGARRATYVAFAILGAWNFLFYIYPHSLVETNTVLRGALAMRSLWKPGTWLYLGSFNADEWTILCFNPGVTFEELDRTKLEQVASELKSREDTGHETWIDAAGIDSLESDSAGREWLSAHTRPGFAHDFSDRKHQVRFLRLFP